MAFLNESWDPASTETPIPLSLSGSSVTGLVGDAYKSSYHLKGFTPTRSIIKNHLKLDLLYVDVQKPYTTCHSFGAFVGKLTF